MRSRRRLLIISSVSPSDRPSGCNPLVILLTTVTYAHWILAFQNAVANIDPTAFQMRRSLNVVADKPVVIERINIYRRGVLLPVNQKVTQPCRLRLPLASGIVATSLFTTVQPCAGRQRSGR